MKYNQLTKKSCRFSLFIIILFSYFNSGLVFSQNNLKSEQKKNSNQKANNSKQRVIITGTTDDPKAFNYFNVLNYSYLFASNHKETTKKVIKDCLYLRLDSLKSPSIMRIFAFGETTRYNLQVYVTPGDSISFEIKNKDIFFKGKNAAHYNFFKEMKTLDLVRPYFNGDLDEYKKKCKILFNRKNDFFKNYINKHKEVSINFIEKVKADIKFNYLIDLMILNKENPENNLIVTEVLSNRLYNNNENTFDIVNYFEDITLNEFNHPEFLDINSFKICLINYIRYYFVINKLKNYSNQKFIEEKKFILSKINGDLQQFAIMMLINDYSKNLSDLNIDNLLSLIKEYKHNFTNPSYNETINKIESALKITNRKLNEKVLKSKVVNLNGNTLIIENILNKKNKIKVIDFWASWCLPCIEEIKKGKIEEQMLLKNDSIQYIYLSIDKDKDKWISISNKLNKYFLSKEQYLVINDDTKVSELLNYFEVNSIPRYVIISKHGEVIEAKAPRPSDTLNFNRIINKINSQK